MSIPAVFDDRQKAHDPKHFILAGERKPNPEVPRRAEILRAGAEAAKCVFRQPEDAGAGPIAALHSPEYLEFLRTIHSRWRSMEKAGDEVVSNISPADRSAPYPRSPVGQAGYHQKDTACPINADTWKSIYWSAQCAITGADLVAGDEPVAYALSRPPGHHAFADMASGFCFLNNAGIAAERLRSSGFRPAIIDVDVHHGNGTQALFYARSDIFTASVHADPHDFYPFFWGYEHERGEGEARGYNLNIPLPRGTGDSDYLAAIDRLLDRTAEFGADVIVVALGLDASEHDPFQGFKVTRGGFASMGARFASTNKPVLFVQEGGYVTDALGDNLTSVLDGFQMHTGTGASTD